jgi:hypothetical protein
MGSQLFRALDSLKSYPIDSFKEKFKDETRLDNQELIAETEMLFNNGELLASLERLESISPLQQISSEVQEKRQKIFRAYAYEFLLKQKKQSLNRAEYDAGMIELIQKNREIQLPKASLQKCQIKEYLDYVSKDIYAEARSYSVSLNSLDKNKDEYTLNGFKQCIEKLVSIESAFLAISY